MMGTLCHVCGYGALRTFDRYSALPRITSDFRLRPAGGVLAVCLSCGAVQKPATPVWRQECQEIYASYVVYRQGSGSEQAVFASSGAGEARSRALLRRLATLVPSTGRHLDFGCGDGSLLHNATKLLPGWRRAGAELNDSRRPEIEAIDGVDDFYAGDPTAIPSRFDLVTAVHVIEHFERPTNILSVLRQRLAPNGRLMVQVPDVRNNPFDLLIADHAVHFSPTLLARCLAHAGLKLEVLTDGWVARELSAIATGDAVVEDFPALDDPLAVAALVETHLSWLERLAALVREIGPVALFGTSIAATWVAANAPDLITCFVDEDVNRVGTNYFNRPVYHPDELPVGTPLLLAHTPAFAEVIAERLAASGRLRLIFPPPMATARVEGFALS